MRTRPRSIVPGSMTIECRCARPQQLTAMAIAAPPAMAPAARRARQHQRQTTRNGRRQSADAAVTRAKADEANFRIAEAQKIAIAKTMLPVRPRDDRAC